MLIKKKISTLIFPDAKSASCCLYIGVKDTVAITVDSPAIWGMYGINGSSYENGQFDVVSESNVPFLIEYIKLSQTRLEINAPSYSRMDFSIPVLVVRLYLWARSDSLEVRLTSSTKGAVSGDPSAVQFAFDGYDPVPLIGPTTFAWPQGGYNA